MKRILLFAAILISLSTQGQSTHTVINTNDSGPGSLRQMVANCVAGDTIRFSPSLLSNGSDSIVLTTGEIAFGSKRVVVKGVLTSSDTLYISGNNNSRIFSFQGAGKVVLDSVALINGNGVGVGFANDGGAIYRNECQDTLYVFNSILRGNQGEKGGAIFIHSSYNNPHYSSIKLVNSKVQGNTALQNGGGIYINSNAASMYSFVEIDNSVISGNMSNINGGGVFSSSSQNSMVKVKRSIIFDNTANNGGGIYSYSAGNGSSESIVDIVNSTVKNNSSSQNGGGISSYSYSSKINLSNSTISGNSASVNGGGLYGYSHSNTLAYADSISTTISLESSTLTGNTANKGGGVFCYSFTSASVANALVNVLNSTISGNSANIEGDGVYTYIDYLSPISSSEIFVQSSIVAENGPSSSGIFNVVTPTINSNGYNIFSDAPVGNISTDLSSVNSTQLNLQPLANNGGITLTMMPGIGSVALDSGNPNDAMDAQNGPVVGVRNIGATEDCYALPSAITVSLIGCSTYTVPSGNYSYAQSGIYYDTLVTSCGADSVITINLVSNATQTIDVVSACDSLTWIDGITYYSSNTTATDTLVNTAGCDSVVMLDLTIMSPSSFTDVITACDSLTWIDGVTYYSSNNTAIHTLVNTAGCDSLVTLDLTIISPSSFTDMITACDSLTWINGVTYYSSNNMVMDTLVNAAGCDSVVTLDLTIVSPSSFTDVITACDSLTWIDGVTYYSNNSVAKDTLINSVGCDSIVTLDLTIETLDSSVVQNRDTLTAVESMATYQWFDCQSGLSISGANNQQFIPSVTGSYGVVISSGTCVDTSGCNSVVVCNAFSMFSYLDNGAGSYDFTDNSIGSYTQAHWSFGDGMTSFLSNPNHVYQANGNYVVVLTIKDSLASNSCINYYMDTISVTGVGISLVCQAGFSVYYDTILGSVNVVNSSIGSSLTYAWDFGDGSSSTFQYPTHSYTSNGPFNLCLTIDDGNGCTDSYCDSIVNTGVWFRSVGFDLIVEGAEPNNISKVEFSNNIHIYPNPVHDQVNIEITNWPTNGVAILVRDVTGKQVYTQKVEPISNKEIIPINTIKWAKGTYFIEVGEGENRVVEKIVVQ